jgi:hypothetical protein
MIEYSRDQQSDSDDRRQQSQQSAQTRQVLPGGLDYQIGAEGQQDRSGQDQDVGKESQPGITPSESAFAKASTGNRSH